MCKKRGCTIYALWQVRAYLAEQTAHLVGLGVAVQRVQGTRKRLISLLICELAAPMHGSGCKMIFNRPR
jgi:hypothetical protein